MYETHPPQALDTDGDHWRSLEPDQGLATRQGALVTRIERVAPAAREEQLARDREHLLRLQLTGFSGRPWNELERDLVHYGRRVLPAKIRSGEIFAIMQDLGLPTAADLCVPPGPAITREDLEDLTQEVLAKALPAFKALLRAGAWDGTREHVACLRTFFIGKCAIEFRAPWRRWLRARQRRLRLEDPRLQVHDLPERPDERSRPDRAAVIRMDLAKALGMLDHDLRVIAVLDAYEWTDREIARQLGTTAKAVEYRLTKVRKRLADLRDAHGKSA